MPGKISHLPRDLRAELNRRIEDGETSGALLPWLNSLPEVQQILAAHFKGKPVTKNNLTSWKKHGFRKWQLRHTALEFVSELAHDAPAAEKPLTDTLSDKLARWAAIRYAATADALTGVEEEPQAEMRHLRDFCADITTLRRGDLSARRLALERQRLALLQSRSDEQKDSRRLRGIRYPAAESNEPIDPAVLI